MKRDNFLCSIVCVLIALFLFFSTFTSYPAFASTKYPVDQLTFSSQAINKLYGINFSPYIDEQNPEYGSQVDRTQISERMKIIAPYTFWIRTYGVEGGLEYAGPVAHEMGLKTAIGAWLRNN